MLLDNRRTQFIIILSLTIVFIVGSYFIVTQEISNVQNTISERATERANKIKEKMVLIQSFIKIMRDNLKQNIAMQENIETLHPAVKLIKDFPKLNISAIDENSSAEWMNIKGIVRSIGSVKDVDLVDKKEISAALYLRSTFLNAYHSISDMKWVFYLSKNNFIYTIPHHPLGLLNFNKNGYKKDYWVKANPENNPQRALVMTNIYQDSAGKGYLVTFSMPVYVDEQFRGIIGIDLSLGIFNTIMKMNHIIGDSFLLDERNSVLASDSLIEMGKTLSYPEATIAQNGIFPDGNEYDYLRIDIIPGEVKFIHQLSRQLKYKAAFYNSLRELFLLLSSVVMAYMIYYFRVLIYRVVQLANTDPLTSLLNRRAMENSILPLLSVNERYEQRMCFLLADIDHFKIVNDTYGHVVGDEVLISVTSILNSCLRNADLISRHGGEEFLIALPQTDLESGSLLAERIRTSIENTRTGNDRVAVTISIGCIEVRKDETFDSAITRADKMLYQAKSDGRNRTVIDS